MHNSCIYSDLFSIFVLMKYSKARDKPNLNGVAMIKMTNSNPHKVMSISGLSPK